MNGFRPLLLCYRQAHNPRWPRYPHLQSNYNMRLAFAIFTFTTMLISAAALSIAQSSSAPTEPPHGQGLRTRASSDSSGMPASGAHGPAWHEHPIWEHPSLHKGAKLWPSSSSSSDHYHGQHGPHSPTHSSGRTPPPSKIHPVKVAGKPQRVNSFSELISSPAKTNANKGKESAISQTSHAGHGGPQQIVKAKPKRIRKRPGERPPGYSGKGRPLGSKDSYKRPRSTRKSSPQH